MKNPISCIALLAAVTAAAATLVAMRVDTEAVRSSGDGTVMAVVVQVAPEDRSRTGPSVWLRGELQRGGEVVDRFDSRAEVDGDGAARVERTWAPGWYELRVDLEGLRGGASGFWTGRVRVPELEAPQQPPTDPVEAAAPAAADEEADAQPTIATETEAAAEAEAGAGADVGATAATEEAAAPSPTPTAVTAVPSTAAEGLPTTSAPAPPAAPLPGAAPGRQTTMTVIVTDSGNRPVTGLQGRDFQLEVDGRQRPVASFAGSDSPFQLVLAVDTSATVEPYLGEIRRVLSRLTERVLGAAGDLQVITCDTHPTVALAPGSGARDPGSALTRAGEAEEGPLAALVSAALVAAEPLTGRRAVVVISDGGDTSDRGEWRSAERAAAAAGVPVLTVALDRGDLRSSTAGRLRKVAEASGGKHYLISDPGVLELTLDHFADLLDASYAVGLLHSEAGERRIRVTAGDGLEVRHSEAVQLP